MASNPINLVLDWDGTITAKDTMFAYGKIADIRDARLGKKPAGTEPFKGFGKAWMDDYSAHEEAYMPKAQDRKRPAQENAWLESLSVVEKASAERVERSGFFAGVTHQDVSNAAKDLLDSGEVSLRTGWRDVFSRAFRDSINRSDGGQEDLPGLRVSILSVNWSETFIRSSLLHAASCSPSSSSDEDLTDFLHKDVSITANEIGGLHKAGGSSGLLTNPSRPIVRTSSDKLEIFKTQDGALKIYVGDSATDFGCLLEADVGICIRDEPMGSSARTLAETLSRVGWDVRHVAEISTGQALSTSESNLLWARDLKEVMILLEGLQESSASWERTRERLPSRKS